MNQSTHLYDQERPWFCQNSSTLSNSPLLMWFESSPGIMHARNGSTLQRQPFSQ